MKKDNNCFNTFDKNHTHIHDLIKNLLENINYQIFSILNKNAELEMRIAILERKLKELENA